VSRNRIGIRIESVANKREHWGRRAERAAMNRQAALVIPWRDIDEARAWLANGGLVVRLTRVAPRELDDDNLRSGFKALRDGIAMRLNVDDRDRRVRWEYAEIRGGVREHDAIVELGHMVDEAGPCLAR
jgi:hypothetical protein